LPGYDSIGAVDLATTIAIVGLILSAVSTAFTAMTYLQDRSRIRFERKGQATAAPAKKRRPKAAVLPAVLAQLLLSLLARPTDDRPADYDPRPPASIADVDGNGGTQPILITGEVLIRPDYKYAPFRRPSLIISCALIIATALYIWLARPF
jgi:hypothetical protein